MSKNIRINSYTGDIHAILNATPDKNGSQAEKIAWYINGYYAGAEGNEFYINDYPMGLACYNRHVMGELPAVFSVNNADGDHFIRLNVSEPTTITAADGATISFNGTDWASGEIELNPAGDYTQIYFKGVSGTLTIPKRKYVTYLYIWDTYSYITSDITGMALTYLHMRGTNNYITGNITGMALTTLYLSATSSYITGNITGMELTYLLLYYISSSLNYGQNPLLNITNNLGIQLLGNTVFTAEEYIRLFADAANCVANYRWTASTKVFTISGGDNPGWSNVSEYYTTIIGGGVTVKVPLSWESGDDAFPPETQNP